MTGVGRREISSPSYANTDLDGSAAAASSHSKLGDLEIAASLALPGVFLRFWLHRAIGITV